MRTGNLFHIRREERGLALSVLLLLIALNALVILKYLDIFTPLQGNYWNLFIGKFHVSGFDPITYYVVSDWEARYNVYRHPLLSFLMWVPYMVNQGCMSLFGINCVQFIVALMLIFAAFYAFLFLYRICREIIGLARFDAALLSYWLYSFAFVMLSAMVPDHFILSMFALLLMLYLSGRWIKARARMGIWKTLLLFLLTAGISLNNGLKVFLAALFINRRRFFRVRYLLLGIVLPALLLWMGARYEYHYLVAPNENARHTQQALRKAERKRQDSIRLAEAVRQHSATGIAVSKETPRPVSKKRVRQGAPFMQGQFMRWSDKTTPRWESIVENLLGESIQLHPDYLLQDEYRSRPMIVKYRWMINYGVEALLVLLFLLGVVCGFRSRFLWLALSWFALDLLLHIGLGFGINEVYIMSAHWIFVIPIGVGYLLKALAPCPRGVIRVLLVLMTLYLYVYNGYFIIKYMVC